jgi:TIR domain
MVSQTEWDVFISHASEDKEKFVKPLATILARVGVEVWYDEFTLKAGDSLMRSIDKGLAHSKSGVVVISRAFIEKKWPEYELRGLITLEMSSKNNKVIPVWYGVSHDEVMAFSPTLADKLELDTTRQSIETIALRIIEIVRPDIMITLKKRALFLEALQAAKLQSVPINKIIRSPIRHATLSESLLRRSHLVSKVLQEVSPLSLEELIDSFRRDLYPQDSIEDWETLAIAYLNLTQNRELEIEQKKEIFNALLLTGSGSIPEEDLLRLRYITPEMIAEAFRNVIPTIKGEEKEQSTPNV